MTGSGLDGKVQNQSAAGRSKIEQLVSRVYSLMVRCKQILFKSTERNQGRLAQGGEIRGRGRQAAWEPGEGVQVAGKVENTGSGKAEVTPPPAYLWRGVLREQTCGHIVEREEGGVGAKEAQGDGVTSNLCPDEGAGSRSQQEDTVI